MGSGRVGRGRISVVRMIITQLTFGQAMGLPYGGGTLKKEGSKGRVTASRVEGKEEEAVRIVERDLDLCDSSCSYDFKLSDCVFWRSF